MQSTLCIIGGCNGAGKTTLARELLPQLGIMRFLNADEIAKGLSPLDPTLVAFKAGRLLIEEMRLLMDAGTSFAIESTLSGRTYVVMLREARKLGYRILLHYIMIGSASQAVERVSLRVSLGGHDVPEDDIRRRFERSRKHLVEDYLPLADEWVVWDNQFPPYQEFASSRTQTIEELTVMLTESKLREEAPAGSRSRMVEIGLEAGRIATAKMVDYYKRMGIEVTPQMTLVRAAKTQVSK